MRSFRNPTRPNPLGWSLERICLVGLVMAAAFAAYISLVPFNFQPVSAESFRLALAGSVEAGISSRGNFVANIVLFVPIGFLGAAAFGRRSSVLARIIAIASAAALLSVSIEALQVFVPGRTPSLADVAAQLLGTGVGFGLWLFTRDEIRRWDERLRAGDLGSSATTLLAAYAICRAVSMLLPLDVTVDLGTLAQKYRAGSIRLLPFTQVSSIGDFLPDAATTILLSIPLGVLAATGWTRPGTRRSLPVAVFASTTFLALVELAQVFVMSRVADATDILIGATGAAIGAVLAGRRATSSGSARGIESLGPALAMGAAAVLYVIYNWSPFDFEISRTLASQRVHLLGGVPFSNYYQNSELQAVSDFVTKLLLAMPVGVALRMLAGSRAAVEFPKIWWCLTLTLAGAFFSVVEVGQLFLVSRYPDNTDIFIAMLGCVAGAWLTAQLVPRREPSTSRR